HQRWPTQLAYAPDLARALRDMIGSFDVVDVHSLYLYPSFAAFRAASSARVPYIVWPHGAMAPNVAARHRLFKRASGLVWHDAFLRNAAGVHVTSPLEEDWAIVNVPRARIFTFPNGAWST